MAAMMDDQQEQPLFCSVALHCQAGTADCLREDMAVDIILDGEPLCRLTAASRGVLAERAVTPGQHHIGHRVTGLRDTRFPEKSITRFSMFDTSVAFEAPEARADVCLTGCAIVSLPILSILGDEGSGSRESLQLQYEVRYCPTISNE